MDKLAMLRSFCEKAPGDPFPRYGVAMELRRGGDLAGAVAAFAAMAKDFPDYVPQYLMAGQTLREMGDVPAARAVLDARARATLLSLPDRMPLYFDHRGDPRGVELTLDVSGVELDPDRLVYLLEWLVGVASAQPEGEAPYRT